MKETVEQKLGDTYCKPTKLCCTLQLMKHTTTETAAKYADAACSYYL